MKEHSYPRTKTPPNAIPLHRCGGDMLSPYKVLGQFWEIDQKTGEKVSDVQYGILEWDPSQKIKELTLFSNDEEGIKEMLEDESSISKPVCLQGVSLQNMNDGKMGSVRFSLDAFSRGGTFTAAMSSGYDHIAKRYLVNGIWTGDTSINLHSARYTQMGFSFKGLEKWIRHSPEFKLSNIGSKGNYLDTFERDILRDMKIPNIGRLRLLCGHQTYGDFHLDRSLVLEHQWQIDFSKPKTYQQCRDIIHAIWDCINIAIGAVVPLKYIVLTKGDRELDQPERFSVRTSYNTSDTEGSHAADVLGYRREYIPFSFISGAFLKKWMKVSLDTGDKEFGNYVTLVTENYRIARMPQKYELLTLFVALEAIVKRMRHIQGKNSFPEKELRDIVTDYTPAIFPEGILDIKVEGEKGLLKWAIENRHSKIAHMGVPDSADSYNLPAGIYTECVLRLLVISLLMLEYKLLKPNDIRKLYWESYRSKDELKFTPENFVSATIFSYED